MIGSARSSYVASTYIHIYALTK